MNRDIVGTRRDGTADSSDCGPIGTRRRVLAGVGAALLGGIAGCSGGSGSETEPPEVEETTADPVACEGFGTDYFTFDGGETPLLFDVELPTEYEGEVELNTFEEEVSIRAHRYLSADGADQIGVSISHFTWGSEVRSEPSDDREQFSEIQFGGETVPLYRSIEAGASDERMVFWLPHDDGDGKKYYQTNADVTVFPREKVPPTDACESLLQSVGHSMVESMTPNDRTTI